MVTIPATYANIAANAHAVGGQTQTEACEAMSEATLRRRPKTSNEWLHSMLRTLKVEGAACTEEAEYVRVRTQQVRIRTILIERDAL